MKSLSKFQCGHKLSAVLFIGIGIGFISPTAAKFLSPLGTVFLNLFKNAYCAISIFQYHQWNLQDE